MRFIRLHELRALAVAFALAACLADAALAGFDVAVTPSWMGASNTTSQVWIPMTSSTTVPTAGGPQTPTGGSSNAAGTAGWYDAAAPADGAFVIGSPGGDVYSFGAVIAPTAVVPGFNLSGNSLNVMAEAQSFGGLIDTNDLTATYTDASGTHSVLASSLASFQYTQVYNDGGIPFGGFGTAYTIDHEWTFTLPKDVANLQLSWGWDATSSAIQDLAIYTQSVAVITNSTWTGGAGTSNWAAPGNWTGSVPGATTGTTATASVVFNAVNATNPVPLIDAGRNIQNITFDNNGGNLTAGLTVGTTGGNPLLLSGGGTIQTTASVANPQTINAPLVLEGNYAITSGAGNSSATLNFGGEIKPGATSGITTLTLNGSNSGANTISGVLADNGAGLLAIAKSGSGTWMLSGANTFSGGVSVAAGTLELSGAVSALPAGANRQSVTNNSSAIGGGLLIAGTHQRVGGVDGTGSLVIEAGGDLTADHVVQSALIIGGSADAPALLTIAPSDSTGHPMLDSPASLLGESKSLALTTTDSLAAAEPFGVGGIGSSILLSDVPADRGGLAALSPLDSVSSGALSAVPEPSTLALTSLAALGLLGVRRFGRRS